MRIFSSLSSCAAVILLCNNNSSGFTFTTQHTKSFRNKHQASSQSTPTATTKPNHDISSLPLPPNQGMNIYRNRYFILYCKSWSIYSQKKITTWASIHSIPILQTNRILWRAGGRAGIHFWCRASKQCYLSSITWYICGSAHQMGQSQHANLRAYV